MTIRINAVSDDVLVISIKGAHSMAAFRELVQRATNLWPDAAPAIKQFADEITNPDLLQTYYPGKLQDYDVQNTSPNKKLVERKLLTCNTCQSDNLVDVVVGSVKVDWHCTHCLAANVSEKV